jgi:hypothetical protein
MNGEFGSLRHPTHVDPAPKMSQNFLRAGNTLWYFTQSK